MIAAIAMGNGVLPLPATFDITILMVALTIHFVVAIILAIVFALIADAARWSLMTSATAGLEFGFLIYFVNFYGMTMIYPWFAIARRNDRDLRPRDVRPRSRLRLSFDDAAGA